jgi:HK97 family phage prohead protease
MKKTIEVPTQFQLRQLSSGRVDRAARTVEFSFSSEEPYERAFGVEILDHSPGAIVDERFRRGAVPFLVNHNWDHQIGRVLSYSVAGTRAFAKVKLSRSEDGILDDIEDGIRSNISVGYVVHEMTEIGQEGGKTVYKVTKWEPLEISLVSVPADSSVGIGRGEELAAERAFSNALEEREWENCITSALLKFFDEHGGVEHCFRVWRESGLGSNYTNFLRSAAARAERVADLFQGWPIR